MNVRTERTGGAVTHEHVTLATITADGHEPIEIVHDGDEIRVVVGNECVYSEMRYSCGAAYCDDPACATHGKDRHAD